MPGTSPGNPVRGEVGELVITKPMPSMPVAFWNDADGSRYRDAYFEMFPGVWRHGDWITITDHGSIVVHGRSDSTLNRHGIRMGSADIYQAVERCRRSSRRWSSASNNPTAATGCRCSWCSPTGVDLTDELRDRIKTAIRPRSPRGMCPTTSSPRPGVPHTRTGKKLEVPIKKLLQGADPARIVERSAVDEPSLIDWFAAIRR